MKLWGNKYKLHIVFWAAYLFLEVYLEFIWSRYQFPRLDWEKRLFNNAVTEFGFLFIKIPLAYSLYFISERKHLKLMYKIGLYTLVFIMAILFHRLYVHDLIYPNLLQLKETFDGINPEKRINIGGVLNAFMDLIFMTVLFFGVEITRQKMALNQKISELNAERLDNELRMLKAQINPHFLFNSLNNIYGLALGKSEETPDVILQLSKIMRYNIYEASNDKISIEKDVENIRDFIEINKIRHYQLEVNFRDEIDHPSLQISPLILIQFVENAFKHGVSESIGKSHIQIFLFVKNNVLTFEIENSKENNTPKDSTQLGLKNIKRQLELLYPKHILEIKETKNQYKVYLKIDFTHESTS